MCSLILDIILCGKSAVKMRTGFWCLCFTGLPFFIYAQTGKQGNGSETLIAASQGHASGLFFKADSEDIPLIVPGNFYDERECKVRDGLADFLVKADKKKSLTIGYIGGSITQADDSYRLQSARYIQSLYPKTKITWINAGVAGTGTDLGASRIQTQLLRYKPDLIFIEFAVNGAYQEGMEGMVRQIWKQNPATGICFLYTIMTGQTAIYNKGGIPDNIQGLEEIATWYQIPSVHLGMEAAALEKENKLLWKAEEGAHNDKIIFSTDGIHPGKAGGNLYAAAIARAFIKIKRSPPKRRNKKNRQVLPAPLLEHNWENAGMYPPLDIADFSGRWKKLDTRDSLNKFAGWFPYVMSAETPGASLSFRFKGDAFGFFDIGGPEAGQLEITIDGKPVKLKMFVSKGYRFLKAGEDGTGVINRFNIYCNNRYRGQYEFVELPYAEHSVCISLSAREADKAAILGKERNEDIIRHPEKYHRTVWYIGKLLVKGEVILK